MQVCILFHRVTTLNLPICILCKKRRNSAFHADSYPKHKALSFCLKSLCYISDKPKSRYIKIRCEKLSFSKESIGLPH